MLTSVDVRTGLAFCSIGMLLGLRDELAVEVDDHRDAPAFTVSGGVGASVRLTTVDGEIERRAASWLHLAAGTAATGWHGGWHGALGQWWSRKGLFAAEIAGIRVGGLVHLRSSIATPRCRPDLALLVPAVAEATSPFWRVRHALAEARARVDRAIADLCDSVAVPATVDDIRPSDLGRVFGLTVRAFRSRAEAGRAAAAVPTMVLGADGDSVWPVDPRRLSADTPPELRPTAQAGDMPPLLFAGPERRRELVEWCLEDLRRSAAAV